MTALGKSGHCMQGFSGGLSHCRISTALGDQLYLSRRQIANLVKSCPRYLNKKGRPSKRAGLFVFAIEAGLGSARKQLHSSPLQCLDKHVAGHHEHGYRTQRPQRGTNVMYLGGRIGQEMCRAGGDVGPYYDLAKQSWRPGQHK